MYGRICDQHRRHPVNDQDYTVNGNIIDENYQTMWIPIGNFHLYQHRSSDNITVNLNKINECAVI